MLKRDRYKGEFEKAKPIVLERDGEKCVKCGLTFSLEVHHIEGYKHNHPDALITLCYFCHGVAPMGKEPFHAWMITGKSGIEVLEQKLYSNGLHGITREQIVTFCSVLVKLDLDFRVTKFRIARERIRKSGVRCDGVRPYGTLPGEEPVLSRIAELLNSDGILARSGKQWIGPTIAKIIRRVNKYQS